MMRRDFLKFALSTATLTAGAAAAHIASAGQGAGQGAGLTRAEAEARAYVGDKVNQMLQEIGHATIVFAERHEDHDLPNTIYVSPYQLPALSVGTEIIYR